MQSGEQHVAAGGHLPKTVRINPLSGLESIRPGPKPVILCAFCGTTEVVPFQNSIYATISSVVNPKFVERQPQIPIRLRSLLRPPLRAGFGLRLPQNMRQTPLRMTRRLWCELQRQNTRRKLCENGDGEGSAWRGDTRRAGDGEGG